ncbi:DNA primase [Blochmannia endosymbiont of Colobopsis nipponica]|uniref:DNA primase n=1 Tax=Blochmannia endosymbiont of Colobopsis nipponica TaxID=2681987 RepID=UPI00178459EA|nr:DNA primase [Blochmannia endosymbiont of Colobopsis nipponica]QOI11328.1 DNA primase [Blochmannia endosymbiont of Colobopsis nipponica]
MSNKIPQTIINELIAKTNIINIINQRIKLKKHGKNFYACCPFHYEKRPSFTANEEKQFFYCFSCGIHGNAIDFIMYYNKLNFIESIKELAHIHNVNINHKKNNYIRDVKKHKQHEQLYLLMNRLSNFYQNILTKTTSRSAREYLQNRGIDQKTIQQFDIGFAPENYDNIITNFDPSEETRSLLVKTGVLILNKQGQTFDRFRKRIMFPIKNHRGQVIAFGGRIINNKEIPKYLNSPESDIFYKKNQLYGLYEIKKTNQKLTKILIVEGYLDVITLVQFGINYVVASLGTSTTSEQIQQLFCITNKIICCYDGDKAGQKAAWRMLKMILPYLNDNRQVYFMFLPAGEDPDTMIRKIGKKSFTMLIEQAQPLSVFLFNKLLTQTDLSTPEGRAHLSVLAIPIINKIPGEILRICLRQKLGEKIGILDEIHLEKFIKKKSIKETNLTITKQTKNKILHTLIRLLIQRPQLATYIHAIKTLEKINLPEMITFVKLVKLCKTQSQSTSVKLLEYCKENQSHLKLETFTLWKPPIIDKNITHIFIDTLIKLYDNILQKRQEKLIAQDRIEKLTIEERKELWLINKTLTNNINLQ